MEIICLRLEKPTLDARNNPAFECLIWVEVLDRHRKAAMGTDHLHPCSLHRGFSLSSDAGMSGMNEALIVADVEKLRLSIERLSVAFDCNAGSIGNATKLRKLVNGHCVRSIGYMLM